MVSDGDLEEVPSDGDGQEEVDDEAKNRVQDIVLSVVDNGKDAENDGHEDAGNVEDLREPDDLACGFLVALFEPLVPDPGVVETDEGEEDGDEAGDDIDSDQQNGVDGVEDTTENGENTEDLHTQLEWNANEAVLLLLAWQFSVLLSVLDFIHFVFFVFKDYNPKI